MCCFMSWFYLVLEAVQLLVSDLPGMLLLHGFGLDFVFGALMQTERLDHVLQLLQAAGQETCSLFLELT